MGTVTENIAHMEMIYIDSADDARQTGVCAAMDTDDATLAAFNSYRRLEVTKAEAKFLLDYHDANGDLCDTILLDESGFRSITGENPKTDAEYRKIDANYWVEARKERDAARVVQP